MTNPTTTTELFTLIERSGLLAPEQLESYRLWPGATPPDEIAQELVEQRHLTAFQARLLLRGKAHGFFLTEKFKILDLLGEGGMGRVLLCEHLALHKLVAVKLLHLSGDSSPGAEERFLREARAAAAVDHPNVVRVYDVDRAGPTPFMVMQYVDGTNLHQLVASGGRLPIDRAIEYVRQAAVGLDAAHRAGLVHRDIKPGNLLLDRAGVVKVLDLGLARFSHEAHRNANLTQKFDGHSILGTVDFMAPEQTENSSRVDSRADIYSLGYTFYYLLTGKLPFGDGSPAQKLLWHQNRHPESLSAVRGDVPPAVCAVLEHMIEKRPEDRYQTPAEVAQALRPLLTAPVHPPDDDEMPRTRRSDYLLGLSGPPAPAMLAYPPADPNTPSPSVPDTLPHQKSAQSAGSSVTPGKPSSFPISFAPPAAWPSSSRPAAVPAMPRAPSSRPRSTPTPAATEAPAIATRSPWLRLIGFGSLLALATLATWAALQPPPTPAGVAPLPADSETKAYSIGPLGLPTGVVLRGGGSTFIEPVMNHWATLYEQQFGVKIEYRAVGSSKGVAGTRDGFLDFGCTDIGRNHDARLPGAVNRAELISIPLAIGAVVPTYNLPELQKPLRFTGPVLAEIFLGKITTWNDDRLRASNPGVALPARPITVVRRAEGSGTTFIFTSYLSQVSGEWQQTIGTTTDWKKLPKLDEQPWGVTATGNSGVAREVSRTVGAIGYVELTFALSSGLPVGLVQNRQGVFVVATPASVAAAATAANQFRPPADALHFTLTDAPGEESYPIVGTVWAVLSPDRHDNRRSEAIAFLRWCVSEGQQHLNELQHAPLPPEVGRAVQATLDQLEKKR